VEVIKFLEPYSIYGTSVICQFNFQVFSGFLGFLGSRKPENLETSKPGSSQLKAIVFDCNYTIIR